MLTKQQITDKYGKASSRYSALLTARQSHEGTWRDCAALTLPYVFPEANEGNTTFRETPYNSIGPKAVNSLASKLLLALLPQTGNFFRLLPYKEEMDKLEVEEQREVDKELSQLERDITERISIQGLRVPLIEAIKSLVVTGNTLLYKIPGGSFKIFSPYDYVVQRDYAGDTMEIVIKESISKRTLPKEVQDQLKDKFASSSRNGDKPEDEVDIYTVIVRKDSSNWCAYQEAGDLILDSSIVEYKDELLPYMPLRWTSVPNEDYGRGQVEQVLGDLRSLEGLTQLLVEGTSVMAKTIFGLVPGSMTKLDDLKRAANGDVIVGNLETDITTMRVDKNNDFAIPAQLKQELETSIGKAFLSFTNTVRDSERTTAVEVRATQAELQSTLAGPYAIIAQELQLPLLRLELAEINSKILKMVTPSIVTGTSAISREQDLENLNYMAQTIAAFGETGLQYFNMAGYLTSLATALGIDPELIVKSKESMQAEQAQRVQEDQQMQANQPQEGGQPV